MSHAPARCLLALTLACMSGRAWCEPPAAVAASKAASEAAAVSPEARNAAIKYLLAMLQTSRELEEKIAQVDYEACGVTHESQEGHPAFAAAARALEGHDLQSWMDASRLAKCDFEWPREQGWRLLLPHLGKMRSEARILRFAARRELGENHPIEAAERLATIVRMANHVSNDEIVISALVSTAMTSLSLSEMRTLAESGRMNDAARTCMLAAVDALGTTDPCGIRRSIKGERGLMLRATMTSFTGPDAGRKFAEFITSASEEDEATKVRALAVTEWNQERLEAETSRAAAAYDALEEAWDASDASEALKRVEERIGRDEFGIVAATLCPSVAKVHASSVRLAEDIASTTALIRAAKSVDAPTLPTGAGRPTK